MAEKYTERFKEIQKKLKQAVKAEKSNNTDDDLLKPYENPKKLPELENFELSESTDVYPALDKTSEFVAKELERITEEGKSDEAGDDLLKPYENPKKLPELKQLKLDKSDDTNGRFQKLRNILERRSH